jgi:hypothetical protein
MSRGTASPGSATTLQTLKNHTIQLTNCFTVMIDRQQDRTYRAAM